MSLLIPTNTTCDVYRSGNAPPAAPDVAAVPCVLEAAFGAGAALVYSSADWVYTHVMLVGPTADVRDSYTGSHTFGAAPDTVYVPDKNGTGFRVVFVEMAGRGSAGQHKRVYLDRRTPTWPTNNL